MSDVIIQVEQLSKQYRLGEVGTGTLSHDLNRWWHRFRGKEDPYAKIGQRNDRTTKTENDYVWALKDVNFEVRQGEILGIIGRNGAGKSTLLKILSRVTAPSSGSIKVKGRIASLLEVGTGFHPELTGRENIYLNGAILGMRKAEITQKLDEIVDFSGCAAYLDTPVKRYSSGMYVRLAFAVAAHLDPEILVVDEVLAVGDVEFQKKCLGKMQSISGREGKTILFVSHNMAAIRSFCDFGMVFSEGRLMCSGPINTAVNAYLGLGTDVGSNREWKTPHEAPGNENITLSFIRITSPHPSEPITIDSGFHIDIGFTNHLQNINLDCTMYLVSGDGSMVCEFGTIISQNQDSRQGFYHLHCVWGGHLLNAGRYSLNIVFGKDQRYVLYQMENLAQFSVDNTATGRGSNMSIAPGVIRPILKWTID
jgi:lipopolysaccharide transport system ATP-binding protein